MARQLADIDIFAHEGAVRMSIRYAGRDGRPDGCDVDFTCEGLPRIVRDLVLAADATGNGPAVRAALRGAFSGREAAHG
jgi:hypothetical protein